MIEASFYMLCEELRPYLTKQTTKLRKPASVETQVAATLYYLADEGRMRKVSNSFGLGKATVSKVIRRVTSVISEKLGAKYIVLPKTKEEVEEHARNFYNRYGFPQCIGAIDGTHIKIKRPVDNPTDHVNRKGNFTLNCQGTVGYNYCFIDVLIKWPGSVHDARVFANSALNEMFRDGSIPKCERIIAEGEPEVPVCTLGDPAYPLLLFLMKEFSIGGKNSSERFFDQRLSSARMVIECAFGRLKARFGCLRKEMDINLKDLPTVIHSCFILHNFCEIRQEAINQNDVLVARNYDVEFQPKTDTGCEINNNEAGGKRIRNIFVKYFK